MRQERERKRRRVRLMKLASQGLPSGIIAERLGMSSRAVYDALRRLGWSWNEEAKRWQPPADDEASS